MASERGIGNLALKIRFLRKERNLTKLELSQICEVSASYLTRLEQGKRKNLTIDTLDKIAKGLQVPLNDLIELPLSDNGKGEELIDVIIREDFLIDGKEASREIKESIIEIIFFLVSSRWNSEFRNQEIFEMLELTDDFKRVFDSE